MKILLKLAYLLFSPVLVVLYWRNTMKELEGIDINYDQYQNQNIDQEMVQA